MSYKKPPPGREFKPKGSIVGTQAHRAVNLGFLVSIAGTAVVSLLLWPYLKDVSCWMKSFDDRRDQDIEWQMTQARLQAIRLAKQRSEDPYHYDSERRKHLPSSVTSNQAKEPVTATTKPESQKVDPPGDKKS